MKDHLVSMMNKIIRWFKVYYWHIRFDLPRDCQRTKMEMFKWVFLFPWYEFLRMLAKPGFLNTPENCYMRLRDFTPFFWRTLIERAVTKRCRYLESKLEQQEYDFRRVLETARRDAQEEVWEYLEAKIDEGFGADQ